MRRRPSGSRRTAVPRVSPRLVVRLLALLLLTFSCLAAAGDRARAGPAPPSPAAADAKAARPAEVQAASAALRSPAAVAKSVTVAQLTYPVPATASATELLQAADDYAFYTDWNHQWQYLQQVISSYRGTKEAGRALALLADHYATTGDQAQAGALNQELASYTDAEVQAFAILVRTVNAAERAQQYDLQGQALVDYSQRWRGTATAGWAALRLGDLYRFSSDNYPAAIATFQGILADYRTGPVAEEALVSLAESLNWSDAHVQETIAAYQQALNTVSTPGLQVRALIGLADMLTTDGQRALAIEILSQVIAGYPTHPSAGHAYALRSIAAQEQGDWETAVADMRAYLTYPSSSEYHRARAHLVSAMDAYRKGDVAGAEAEYSLLLDLIKQTPRAEPLHAQALVGLAACAKAKGDLRGAMQGYLEAADVESTQDGKAVDLFLAADLAQQLNDTITRNQIIARMAAEFPGSHLTAKLVGHELLSIPEI